MNKLSVILSFLFLLIFHTLQSWALPNCFASLPYNNCYGSHTYKSGTSYIGEWQNNKKHGKGIVIFGPNTKWAGDKYEGEFKKDNK